MRKLLRLVPVGLVMSAAAACSSGKTDTAPAGAPAQAPGNPGAALAPSASSASRAPSDMIVILRDQMESVAGRGAHTMRANMIASAHATILADLQAARPRPARSFKLVNAFATSLTSSEAETLSARADVLAVVPDHAIRLPKRPSFDADAASAGGAAAAGTAPAAAEGLCNTLEPQALQLMNAAFLDPAAPQAQRVKDGNGNFVTGSGVTVGIIADGLDTNIPGFIRADGSKVFVDYQDFSGDPATAPTSGGEIFGDASSIAAQDVSNGETLSYDIGKYVSPAHPLPSPCNVRVRGVAPGASLVGLKVFSGFWTTTSNFVQAIEYAVTTDNVDILNESFGGNPYPDLDRDPISLANRAAVRAGVTVVVSSGDAGSAGTLGSPSTERGVIEVGATTQNRVYAQTFTGMYALANGYLDNNISSLSSAGFAQSRPRTVDVVAPGEFGWALCSTNTALYTDCLDFNGKPTPIYIFGGTSESAPLTAGAAALVIQAYRSTHGGASPAPALVKSILMGTANDLGAPSFEQGAGLVDALKAVNAALSVQDDNGAPTLQGSGGLLVSPSAAVLTAVPGERLARTFEVTNDGAEPMVLAPALEKLGDAFAGETVTLTIDPKTAPTYPNQVGGRKPYTSRQFTVPAGADHLDASIAFPTKSQAGNPTIAVLLLVDPQGRQAAYSLPQGYGSGYGHVDVVKPAAGTWTAYVRTAASDVAGSGQLVGAFQFSWSAEKYVSAGRVFPRSLFIAPGETALVSATFAAPATPGDSAAALRFHDKLGKATFSEVPVTVRTLIPTGADGGDFGGTLTGGNGRTFAFPSTTYAFDVPAGLDDLGLSVTLPVPGYTVAGYLVDPNGQMLASDGSLDTTGAVQSSLQLFRANPQAGRWLFVLEEAVAAGTQTAVSFAGHIAFNQGGVTAPALPRGAQAVSAAAGLAVPVTITNTGSLSKAYFVDARSRTTSDVILTPQPCSAGLAPTLPGACLIAAVPTHTTGVRFAVQSAAPISLDVVADNGAPELYGAPSGDGAVVTFHAPQVAFGFWSIQPSLVGPYGAAGASVDGGTPVTTAATVTTQAFDTAVTSTSGDYWQDLVLGTSTLKPVVLAPGATGTITVTVKPTAAQVGKVVRGYLYVDTVNVTDAYGYGDEVARLPYEYAVTK